MKNFQKKKGKKGGGKGKKTKRGKNAKKTQRIIQKKLERILHIKKL